MTKLNALGIRVYGAGALTVKENLSVLSEDKLQDLSVYNARKPAFSIELYGQSCHRVSMGVPVQRVYSDGGSRRMPFWT